MKPARLPRVSLDELEQPCTRCGCQNAVHTRGASRSGWAVFDPTWAAATGPCSSPGCPCPGRSSDPGVARVSSLSLTLHRPLVVEPPPPISTRLTGPCSYGTGPCGKTPTRPYATGPRCVAHEPGRHPMGDALEGKQR